MRIMTTNIWGDYFGNPVAPRMEWIYSTYKNYSPDIIGFQEITDSWNKSGLFERLSEDYNFVGLHVLDAVNYTPVAVKKNYEMIANGFEMLEDTPDRSKVITWAVLRDKDDKKLFGVCNTHFWWMTRDDGDDRIRDKNAAQTGTLMQFVSHRFKCPVFAFGDMNCRCISTVFKVVYPVFDVKQLFEMTDNRDDVSSHHGDPVIGDGGVCTGKRTENDHTGSIDHIVAYGSGFKVKQYRIIEDQYVLDSTDHSPVYADIDLL